MTIDDLAKEAISAFELRTRRPSPDAAEEAFYTIKDNAPEWIKGAVREAHGDDLPNDYAWRVCGEAFQAIVDGINRDEFADDVDVLTHELLEWAGSLLSRLGYCEQAREAGLVNEDATIDERLMAGQYIERGEIFDAILEALTEQADERTFHIQRSY